MQLGGYSAPTWLQLLALTLGAQLLGHSLFNLVLRTTSADRGVSLALLFEVPGRRADRGGRRSARRRRSRRCPAALLLLVGLGIVISSAGDELEPGIAVGLSRRSASLTRPMTRTPALRPPLLPRRAGQQPQDAGQGAGAARRPGVPRPRGRGRAAGQGRRARQHRRGAERGRLGRQDPGGAGQRLTTQWTYRDVIEVVEGAGANLDCDHAAQGADRRRRCTALDLLLTQIEKTIGLEVGPDRHRGADRERRGPGRGRRHRRRVAARRDDHLRPGRLHGQSINMKSLVVGEQPPGYDVGDAYHYILMRILMAARTHDLQAIDGPYLQIRDVDGFRRVAGRSAALGFDGKWVLHPGQIDAANEVYSPAQDDYDHAELILDAYE